MHYEGEPTAEEKKECYVTVIILMVVRLRIDCNATLRLRSHTLKERTFRSKNLYVSPEMISRNNKDHGKAYTLSYSNHHFEAKKENKS